MTTRGRPRRPLVVETELDSAAAEVAPGSQDRPSDRYGTGCVGGNERDRLIGSAAIAARPCGYGRRAVTARPVRAHEHAVAQPLKADGHFGVPGAADPCGGPEHGCRGAEDRWP